MENINFLLVHLRDDLVSCDLKFSMMTSNVLYEKKFLVSTYLKIIDRNTTLLNRKGIPPFIPLSVQNIKNLHSIDLYGTPYMGH